MSARLYDLQARRQALARKRLSRGLPRVWVPEISRWLVALGFFNGQGAA